MAGDVTEWHVQRANLVSVAPQVADQEHDRVVRLADEALAVGECLVDVGAAAELRAEEDFDGVFELVGEVDDGGVEDDELGAQGAQRGDLSRSPRGWRSSARPHLCAGDGTRCGMGERVIRKLTGVSIR
jgi:hypothetical protein